MIELGKKSEIFGAEKLEPLNPISFGGIGRPMVMPRVPQDHKVICGYDQGLGERIFVCETLEEMQYLYDAYARGGALRIHWYSGPDPGFITVISGGQATPDPNTN